MRRKLTQYFWYGSFVGTPSIMGFAFTLLAGFGLSENTAATLFFGIAMANTVRFALSPQTTHWLPKRISDLTNAQAATGIRAVLKFELAAALAIFVVFLAVSFVITVFNSRYAFSDLLPFGVFVFSSMVPLLSTLERQLASIRIPAIFAVSYWFGRVSLLAGFVFLEIPESRLILALVCFEALAIVVALCLILKLLRSIRRDPLTETPPQLLNLDTIRNMLGRSIIRGSLREADILCAGMIGSPGVLVEYRIVRSFAMAAIRGLGPIVDLAFVKLSKLRPEDISQIWHSQKKLAISACSFIFLLLVPFSLFGNGWINTHIAELLRLNEAGMPNVFLFILLTALVQTVFITLYPLAMQYQLYRMVFFSSLAGASLYIPLLLLSVHLQSPLLLAASYFSYIFTILAINFVGIERHVRRSNNTE